jgi:6-phosphogluconolactonase (cycloisomerase 2 family)
VTVFRVNHDSGHLDFTGHYAAVGNPSCILFVDMGKNP